MSRWMNRGLPTPQIECDYLEEPVLRFCGGTTYDQKAGIATFGPYSLSQPSRHPMSCRLALIGSAESVEHAADWIRGCSAGVDGGKKYASFPGCTAEAGFFLDITMSSDANALLTRNERDEVLRTEGTKDRFEAALRLVDSKLKWLDSQDSRPDYVVLALPDDFVEACEVADYSQGGQLIHRDLRRAIKATAMRYRLVTQLLRERTVRGGVGVDHKSKCAWNFFTALYFKLGGIPWSPVGLPGDTCFVGISFFRPLGSDSQMQTSVAQAFNGRGDALVLRGEEFPWNPTKHDKSPHLDKDHAERLVRQVLLRFQEETQGPPPRRIVIHKSTRFTPNEVAGFRAGAAAVRESDLLAVTPISSVRLLRVGSYPPLRGTHFRLGDIDYLYTTGYISPLEAFPHGHVPSPLQIADHHGGDTSIRRLLEELLILTKMNWNSAGYAGLKPVTLRFSGLVGDILKEVPSTEKPLPNFKYYV